MLFFFSPLGYVPSASVINHRFTFLDVSRHLCFWILAGCGPLASMGFLVVQQASSGLSKEQKQCSK